MPQTTADQVGNRLTLANAGSYLESVGTILPGIGRGRADDTICLKARIIAIFFAFRHPGSGPLERMADLHLYNMDAIGLVKVSTHSRGRLCYITVNLFHWIGPSQVLEGICNDRKQLDPSSIPFKPFHFDRAHLVFGVLADRVQGGIREQMGVPPPRASEWVAGWSSRPGARSGAPPLKMRASALPRDTINTVAIQSSPVVSLNQPKIL